MYPKALTLTNSTFCPHSVFMCFVWIWEQTAIISLYSINWLVFITETECVYCAVRTGSFIYNSTFCPHSVFMCFVWISEQTAIISLYSINWLVSITETECVYCAVRTGSFITIKVTVSFQHWSVLTFVALTRRTNGRTLGTVWKAVLFRSSGNAGWEITFIFLALQG